MATMTNIPSDDQKQAMLARARQVRCADPDRQRRFERAVAGAIGLDFVRDAETGGDTLYFLVLSHVPACADAPYSAILWPCDAQTGAVRDWDGNGFYCGNGATSNAALEDALLSVRQWRAADYLPGEEFVIAPGHRWGGYRARIDRLTQDDEPQRRYGMRYLADVLVDGPQGAEVHGQAYLRQVQLVPLNVQ